MDDAAWLVPCLKSLATGVAVADPGTWRIRFENARFFEWFPPTPDGAEDALAARLRGCDLALARTRLEKGRPFAWETQVRAAGRETTLAVTLRIEQAGAVRLRGDEGLRHRHAATLRRGVGPRARLRRVHRDGDLARLEALSEPMTITVSDETRVALGTDFETTDRGAVDVKGFASVRLWTLEDERGRR